MISEFFTTISLGHFFNSLLYVTIKFPFIIKGKNSKKIETKMLNFLGAKNSKIYPFYNGRTAIYQALRLIETKSGDEIIVNSYNCVSVINSIIQASCIPIYAEINKENLSIDVKELEKKITPKTKAIILQHTFGKTGPVYDLRRLANKYKLIIIEDVAHSLGSSKDGIMHGMFGDLSIFSTGRDKVISSVNGGFLLINNPIFLNKDSFIQDYIGPMPVFKVFKNHYYNILAYLSYRTYDIFGLGKLIIFLARKLKLINEVVSEEEKHCSDRNLHNELPNSLARLAIKDLEKINKYTIHRKQIAKFYDENLNFKFFNKAFKEDKNENINYFRYPIIFDTKEIADKYYDYMRKNKVIIGNSWSGLNIAPKTTDINSTMYNFDCPLAEQVSKNILLLPNSKFVSLKDAKRVVKLTNNFTNTGLTN